jgi:hypothetical protein
MSSLNGVNLNFLSPLELSATPASQVNAAGNQALTHTLSRGQQNLRLRRVGGV